MYWDAVLREVLNKQSSSQTFAFTNINKIKKDREISALSKKLIKKRIIKRYSLGIKHKNTYFTNRESDVMIQILQGKTVSEIADHLKLSPRTIEFYVKNMKGKLRCRTKSELIGKVISSDFVKNINFLSVIDKQK